MANCEDIALTSQEMTYIAVVEKSISLTTKLLDKCQKMWDESDQAPTDKSMLWSFLTNVVLRSLGDANKACCTVLDVGTQEEAIHYNKQLGTLYYRYTIFQAKFDSGKQLGSLSFEHLQIE